MQIVDIDDFLKVVREVTKTRGYVKLYHINVARVMHREHTKKELDQLVIEAQKMTDHEVKSLIAIGLRNPARAEILSMMIQRALRDNKVIRD